MPVLESLVLLFLVYTHYADFSSFHSDCEGDLICFQRDLLEPVPGCSGLGQTSYDYCIENPGYAPAPAMAPDALPVETIMPTFGVPEVIASGMEEPASAPLPAVEIVESADKEDKDKVAVGSLGLCQGVRIAKCAIIALILRC